MKRRKEGAKHRVIPILPALRASIDATVTGIRTFIVNEFGKPFSFGGFGNRICKWCDEAGLPPE
ncbi:MAG: hypothetical protein AB7F89_27585 [Pirellulaceae bacterium]